MNTSKKIDVDSTGNHVVLELNHVVKCYGEGQSKFNAIDDASLKVYKGDFLAIIGPSGSGKSTLLHMLGILDNSTGGNIFVDGINIISLTDNERAELRRRKIGFVFQTFNLIQSLTAFENVEIPMVLAEIDEEKRAERAKSLLKKLGILNRQFHYPNQLSGGERQRVAIARALANDPEIILADEPTGNLDSERGNEILEIMKKLNEEGRTIIIITHDLKVASKLDRLVKIRDGKIIERTNKNNNKSKNKNNKKNNNRNINKNNSKNNKKNNSKNNKKNNNKDGNRSNKNKVKK